MVKSVLAALLILVPGFWLSHVLHLVPDSVNPVVAVAQSVPIKPPPLIQGPTLSPQKVDAILCGAGSPACGTGQRFYDDSVKSGIDDAMALAFFHHESSFGLQGAANRNHSVGNIICTPGWTCYDRFRYYESWDGGIDDWFALISGPGYCGAGLCSPETIIPKYAPAVENNTTAYIASVKADMERFRS